MCMPGATFKLTSQAVRAQVDLGHAVAELADVRRQLEASVARQLNRAPLDQLPAQKLDRDGSCARDRISELAMLKGLNMARTLELVGREDEPLQTRQIPDRLGNRACTPRERATGTIRERSSFPSSRSPVLSSLSLV